MKFPKIDLEELKKQKQQNFRERLKFIDYYVEWVKKNSGKKVGEAQQKLIKQFSSGKERKAKV